MAGKCKLVAALADFSQRDRRSRKEQRQRRCQSAAGARRHGDPGTGRFPAPRRRANGMRELTVLCLKKSVLSREVCLMGSEYPFFNRLYFLEHCRFMGKSRSSPSQAPRYDRPGLGQSIVTVDEPRLIIIIN